MKSDLPVRGSVHDPRVQGVLAGGLVEGLLARDIAASDLPPRSINACAICPIRRLSVCSALNMDELDELDRLSEAVRFSPRHVVFHQGDEAKSVFTLTKGMLQLSRLLPDGRRQIVGFLLPGDFVGLSLEARHTYSAEAVEDVAACRFDRRSYEGLVSRKPHLLRRLHQAATHELTVAQDHMVLLGRRSAFEKVAAFLLPGAPRSSQDARQERRDHPSPHDPSRRGITSA